MTVGMAAGCPAEQAVTKLSAAVDDARMPLICQVHRTVLNLKCMIINQDDTQSYFWGSSCDSKALLASFLGKLHVIIIQTMIQQLTPEKPVESCHLNTQVDGSSLSETSDASSESECAWKVVALIRAGTPELVVKALECSFKCYDQVSEALATDDN